jgi:hypothetical protein
LASKSFIPGAYAAFLVWSKTFLLGCIKYVKLFGLKGPSLTPPVELLQHFEALYLKSEAEHDQTTTMLKAQCRAELESAERTIARYLQVHPEMTDEIRLELGLPLRKTGGKARASAAPTERPTLVVKPVDNGQISVAITTDWPENAKGLKILHELGDKPESVADLKRHAVFSSRKKYIFEFNREERGQAVHFAACFDNGRGQSGPYSDIVNTIVP